LIKYDKKYININRPNINDAKFVFSTFAGLSNINIAGIIAIIKDLGSVVGSYRTGITLKNIMGTIRLNIFFILIRGSLKVLIS
jgi:hypothetical protein